MHGVRGRSWFRIVSLVLVLTLIFFDIAQASQINIPEAAEKLSAELPFQTEIMSNEKEAVRRSLFADMKLLASAQNIAKYLLEDRLPLEHLEAVISRETGQIIGGIDLSKVNFSPDKKVVIIPCVCSGHKCLIQVALKDELPRDGLSGQKWVASAKYLIYVSFGEKEESKKTKSEKTPPAKTPPDNTGSRKGKHNLTARNCYRAMYCLRPVTIAVTVVFGWIYLVHGMTDPMKLLSWAIINVLAFTTAYYWYMGRDIRSSMIEVGVPEDKALDEPVSNTEGFLHHAFNHLSKMEQSSVLKHEVLKWHPLGMVFMTPIPSLLLAPYFWFAIDRFYNISSMYAGIDHNNPESIYEYAQLGYPKIRAFAIERSWQIEDIDKMGRLFVLAYGRDSELAEPAIHKLFNSGNVEKIREYSKQCMMAYADKVFDVCHVRAILVRDCMQGEIKEKLAEKLAEHVTTWEDFKRVVALIDHHYERKAPCFTKLHAMAETPGEIEKLFLGERIFSKFGKIRRHKEVHVDPKYERDASYKLARAVAEVYGMSELTGGQLEDVLIAVKDVVSFHQARKPAYTFVEELAENPNDLKRSILAQGGLIPSRKSEAEQKPIPGEEEVELPANNNREKLINACNDMVAILALRSDITREFMGNETNTDIVFTAEALLADLERIRETGEAPILFTEAVMEVERTLRENLREFESAGLVSSIITLARKARREDRNLIIGVETAWIPGSERATMQHMAINPLITDIKSLGSKLRSIGLDNVIIVHDKRDYLAHQVIWQTTKDGPNSDYSNVVILASQDTINSKAFDPLRSTRTEQKAFLAGVDHSELDAFTEKSTEDYTQIRIRLVQMLALALELASGQSAPELPIIREYNKTLRTVIFLPGAEPMDFRELQRLYRAQQKALEAA
ncbi:MAG: hypothetical protein GF409_04115 [Candidatus Omnitrophica bacterium]|nr:hypothetical protein [Candidatus Omnitrophota bacterium]